VLIVRKLSYPGAERLYVHLDPAAKIRGWNANRSVSERPTYNVIVERAGDIWLFSVLSVPEPLASTRRHDRIEAIARVVIAQALHAPQDSFEVEISSSD
jgi:hypothetical protein